MARRCPTIAARAAAIPEIVHDAGILVEPMNPAAFANAVLELYDDPAKRADYVERGLRRIQDFSWRASAVSLYEVIRATAGKGHPAADQSFVSVSN